MKKRIILTLIMVALVAASSVITCSICHEKFEQEFSQQNEEFIEQLDTIEEVQHEEECAKIAPQKHLDIISEELGIVNYGGDLIDSNPDTNWYVYYVYGDGDVYCVTLKNNHVIAWCQMN